jgi:hypothetical protein
MSDKLEELKKQKLEIEKQIAELKESKRESALETVKSLCKEYGFTTEMLKGSLAKERTKKKAGAKK